MKYVLSLFLLCTFLLAFPSNQAGAQSAWPDPLDLLQKADSSIHQLESISYSAEHSVLGLVRFGDQAFSRPGSVGKVNIKRVPADTAFGGYVAVQGTQLRSLPKYEDTPINISYDGERVRVIDDSKRVAYVNAADDTGQSLLNLRSADLLWYYFFSENGLAYYIESDSLRFDGTGVVDGTPSFIIYTMNQDGSALFENWLFLSFEDYLPRKIVERISGIPGQNRTKILTLDITAKNSLLPPETFAQHVPADYEVKVYEGFKPDSKPNLSEGAPAPNWQLSDAAGTMYSLQDLRGKLVIMDFWATWCGACIEGMPGLQELHEEYAQHGLEVLAINVWEGGDPDAFMKKNNFTYTSLLNADAVAEAYNVRGLPTLYVIDSDGKILYGKVGSGPTNKDELHRVVQANLPEYGLDR